MQLVRCALMALPLAAGPLAPGLRAQVDSFDDLVWATTANVTVAPELLLLETGYLVSYAEQASTVVPGPGRLTMDVQLNTDPSQAPDSYCTEFANQMALGCGTFSVAESEELDQGGSSGPFPLEFTGTWSVQVEPDECLTLDATLGGFSIDCFATARYTNLRYSPALDADVEAVSLSTGGVQNFELFAPLELAGYKVLLLGSRSGTSPGLPLGGFLIPLNLDGYLVKTATAPNTPPLSGSLGTLDAAASAQAFLTVPPGVAPQLVGETLHHAFVVVDPALRVEYVSNPVALLLQP